MKLPRFRLRTLLIAIALLSIPMGWVAYHLNWIRERHELLRKYAYPQEISGFDLPQLPLGLRVLGETSHLELGFWPDRDVLKRAKQLFPEVKRFGRWVPDEATWLDIKKRNKLVESEEELQQFQN
jgi:hypothetical protein